MNNIRIADTIQSIIDDYNNAGLKYLDYYDVTMYIYNNLTLDSYRKVIPLSSYSKEIMKGQFN